MGYPCLVHSQELREGVVHEFLNRGLLDQVKDAATVVTDGVAISPFHKGTSGILCQYSSGLQGVDIDQTLSRAFDKSKFL